MQNKYLGGAEIAGNKLKEVGTLHWNGPNKGASNESGFTALPGGNRISIGFQEFRKSGYWWSSTEERSYYSTFWGLFHDSSDIYNSSSYQSRGLSVRCLKD